jgi:short-subunit dehydrogenase
MKTPRAIITGAGRGIGRAVAVGLAEDGYDLALVARTADQLEETARLCREARPNSQIVCIVADITDGDIITSKINAYIAQFGAIEILVNNAGVYLPGTTELTEAEFERQFAVNVHAPFRLLKLVVPGMRSSRRGWIFNVSSRAGKVGFPGIGGYVATKFALNGLSESLYQELNAEGISVTSLCPSWTDTKMAQEGKTPLSSKQMLQPNDILQAIRFVRSLSGAALVKEIVLECRGAVA